MSLSLGTLLVHSIPDNNKSEMSTQMTPTRTNWTDSTAPSFEVSGESSEPDKGSFWKRKGKILGRGQNVEIRVIKILSGEK